MKIILKEPIYNLGDLGDVVTVAGGYARNYLLPHGKALLATKSNLNQFEAERESLVKKIAHLKSEAEQVAEKLNTVAIDFTRKSSDEEKIFGSVTAMDIEASLKEAGYEVSKRDILLPSPIKTTGETKVKIKLDQSVLAEISVTIIAEAVEEGTDDSSYSVAPYPEDAAEVAAAESEGEFRERKPRRAKTEEATEATTEAPAEEATEAAPEAAQAAPADEATSETPAEAEATEEPATEE